MKRYVYFVVYTTGSVTGDIIVYLAEKITCYNQIRVIANGIKEKEMLFNVPVITNFILLREDMNGDIDNVITLEDCGGEND